MARKTFCQYSPQFERMIVINLAFIIHLDGYFWKLGNENLVSFSRLAGRHISRVIPN